MLFLSLAGGGCAAKKKTAEQPPYVQGQFVLPDGTVLSRAEFSRRTRGAEYILVGERHDNAGDHSVQSALLDALAEDGRNPLVGLEMVPRRRYNAVLHDFSAGRLSLDDLPAALDWERTWRFDFFLYRPVFASIRRNALPVYGLNIAHALREKAGRIGIASLSPREKAEMPGRIIPPPAEQREKLADIFLMHRVMMDSRGKDMGKTGLTPGASAAGNSRKDSRRLVMPVTVRGRKEGRPTSAILPLSVEKLFERFLLAQSLWDSTMAEEALFVRRMEGRARERKVPPEPVGPLVILAGAGHVEYNGGIAHRLSLLAPGARIVAILPFSGELPDARSADFFYYSPERPRRGYGLAFAMREGELLVSGVAPDSPAEKAGLRPDDRILQAGRFPASGLPALHRAADEAARRGEPLELRIVRQGRNHIVSLTR
jgi:uncharacterized iron-regulated protein